MKLSQEADVVADRTILTVVALGVAATALGVGVAWGIDVSSGERLQRQEVPGADPMPVPAEMSAIEMTLFSERSEHQPQRFTGAQELESYGWVDRQAGVVHIPIERAMELYLQRREQR